ncbi:hypothetical protein D3C87_1360830 [compost metagenome]
MMLFTIDSASNKLDTISLKFSAGFNLNVRNIYKDIFSPQIYLSNQNGNFDVYNGFITKGYTTKALNPDKFKVIAPNKLIVRARHIYSANESNRALVRLNLSDSIKITKTYFFPRKKNGVFANDGWLHYDKKHAMIFYMYFYRGIILSLDTNLVPLYEAKTIDTVTEAQLKTRSTYVRTKEGKSLKQNTQNGLPPFVYTYMTTYADKIYMLPRLKADNETDDDLSANQAIDVYAIKNGSYLYSFYVPKYKQSKLIQFQLNNNRLNVIFDKYLVIYDFVETMR